MTFSGDNHTSRWNVFDGHWPRRHGHPHVQGDRHGGSADIRGKTVTQQSKGRLLHSFMKSASKMIMAENTYACGQMYFTCGILMPAKASAQPCLSVGTQSKVVWELTPTRWKQAGMKWSRSRLCVPRVAEAMQKNHLRNKTQRRGTKRVTVSRRQFVELASFNAQQRVFVFCFVFFRPLGRSARSGGTYRRSGFTGSRHNGR